MRSLRSVMWAMACLAVGATGWALSSRTAPASALDHDLDGRVLSAHWVNRPGPHGPTWTLRIEAVSQQEIDHGMKTTVRTDAGALVHESTVTAFDPLTAWDVNSIDLALVEYAPGTTFVISTSFLDPAQSQNDLESIPFTKP